MICLPFWSDQFHVTLYWLATQTLLFVMSSSIWSFCNINEVVFIRCCISVVGTSMILNISDSVQQIMKVLTIPTILSFLGAETLIPLWWHSLITSFLEFLPGNDGLQHANIAVPHQCALSASSFPQILPAPIPSYIWPKRPLWPVNISAVRVCEIWNSYLESKFKTPVHQPLGSNSAITSSMEASGLTSKQIWLI